jgi:antitoxin FitA
MISSEDDMAQMVVRKLGDAVREGLRVRASRNGRSVEAEARAILSDAVRSDHLGADEFGLGTEMAGLFAGCDLQVGEIEELRGDWGMRIPDFR